MRFDGLDLTGASFASGELARCSFKGTTLTNAKFNKARLAKCDYDGANLTGARLTVANACDVRFVGAELDGATIKGAITYGDFRRSSLDDAVLDGADLRLCAFDGAKGLRPSFKGTMFDGVRAANVDFRLPKTDGALGQVPGEIAFSARVGGLATVASVLMASGAVAAATGPEAEKLIRAAGPYVEQHLNVGYLAPALGAAATGLMLVMKMDKAKDFVKDKLAGRVAELWLAASLGGGPQVHDGKPGWLPSYTRIKERMREFRLAVTHGFDEDRIVAAVNLVNTDAAVGKEAQARRLPRAAVVDIDGTKVIGYHEDVEKRLLAALSGGTRDVILVVPDAEKSERAPTAIHFGAKGQMTAVWFRNGRPDYAVAYDRKGNERIVELKGRRSSFDDTELRLPQVSRRMAIVSRGGTLKGFRDALGIDDDAVRRCDAPR